MVTTPSKRSATTSPDVTRPSKRQATSSPEEGELDDATPPPPSLLTRLSTPPQPPTKHGNKVPFPFKRKTIPHEDQVEGGAKAWRAPLVYERSQHDEQRFREEDERRRAYSRPGRYDSRPVQSRGADRWEPSVDRYENGVRGRWDHQDTSFGPHYHRERGTDNWDHHPRPPISPRHERERHFSSRSPSSPRSRSPLSPTHKEKHRLPPPRAIPGPLSPLRDQYYDERKSETIRQTCDHSRERRRISPNGRAFATDDRPGQAWEVDRYIPNDEDRYLRTQADVRDGRDERRWDRPKYDDVFDREQQHHRGTESYHPVSPRVMSPRGLLSPRSQPRSTAPGRSEHLTPPPPSTPPPPPPPDGLKNQALPTEHSVIKITLPTKKPATPVNTHSPTPVPLPVAKTDLENKHPDVQYRRQASKGGALNVRDAKAVMQRLKRKPVVRTREEEARVYHRIFVGCGRQQDYDLLTKLGEGTFGEVHKAVHREKGHAVALKRILMHNEKEGMPVTALREIKILKALRHPCIIDILDMFVVKSQGKDSPLSVYMVFPYMDHDLAGLLENERVKLSPSQIKLYMKQLLEGTEYMHRNHILHRDMKAANLLISNTGSLKIADFGLARAFDPNIVRGGEFREDARGKERKYTNCVVTRWYRPPELLLGARQYGGEVDLWGIGCVLGEMFMRRPILPGSSDLDQLDRIWQLCGTPNQHSWPNYDTLPGCEGVKRFNVYPRRLKQVYDMIGSETVDLMDKLLTCNPRDRLTAAQALEHDYFWTDPLPADPRTLPSYEASHEFDKRGRRSHAPVGLQGPPQYMDGPPRQLPLPIAQGPPMHYRGRPPPPREAFCNGPPPQHYPPPPPGQGLPPPTYTLYPPPGSGYPPPQQRFPHGGPPGPMPPASALMPFSLRPGQPLPPPQLAPWQQPPPRPANLPPRPPVPMGRGGGGFHHHEQHHPRHDGYPGYGGGGELNYG
ncbi:hypothetical protein AcV5_000119 [Taiwanofungus camphoratus]|nr:hypothetical protein AcV5_000119 [Antrodia cinnamomea]